MSAPRSEQAFLDIIDRFFPENSPAIRIGRGDDCALFSCPSSLCITTDLFVEDVHFRRSYFSPEQIAAIKKIYKLFYLSGLNVSQAKEKVTEMGDLTPEHLIFVEFINSSQRGIVK